MHRHCLILLCVALLSTWISPVQGEESQNLKIFKVSTAEGYHPMRPLLQNYLQMQPNKNKSKQHFCVIGYNQPTQDEYQPNQIDWVHWVEGARLVLWLPVGSDSGLPPEYTLLHSKRDLDLKKDVVSTPEKIGGSSYLVDRSWVNAMLADCRIRGERLTLHLH